MKKFEKLLLENGNPKLICAFIKEYGDTLSDDFVQNFEFHSEEVKSGLVAAAIVLQDYRKNNQETTNKDVDDFLSLKIEVFLTKYPIRNVTRIRRILLRENIITVADLISCSKIDILRMAGMGTTSLFALEDVLEKFGLSFKD